MDERRVWERAVTWARVHLGVLALLAAIVPSASWILDGSGAFAWTMFSKSETYRIAIRGVDAHGAGRTFNPADLARFTTSSAAIYLAGAETWRHAPVALTLRGTLPSLAALACGLGDLASVEVRLDERADLDAPIRSSVASVACR